jgi:hypothetical protein
LWYKTAALTVLLFLSAEVFANRDIYIVWLPGNAVKKAEKVYTIPLDFDGAVKKVRQRIEQDPMVRSDILLNESGFRIYAFYNLRESSGWRKLFLIEEDGKVTARFF